TILRDYEKWLDNPAIIPKLFATNLPKAAPFFMDYIILYGLGYLPIQLLQLGSISLAAFRRLVCRTPRQFADALRPNYIDWSFILPQPMLIFVIMATYSSLAPLVFVLGALYYTIAYVVTKYLVYYVYSRQFETAGAFVIPVLKLLAGSLWIYYVLIIGLCALKSAFGYVLLLLPLLWANGYLLAFVTQQFYNNGSFLPMDLWNARQQQQRQPNARIAQSSLSLPDIDNVTGGDAEYTEAPSHATSTDYLLPRPHVPSPFGALLDAVDTEYSGAVSRLWEALRASANRAWAAVFSRIYINPKRTPSIFRDLDRCYSLNIDDDVETGQGSVHDMNLASATSLQATNGTSPRFSTTFEDNGGDYA
ncbi:hypothetical protein GGI12_006085, partial [Dipsacomyces acuminosporus]